ncbi:NAD(P)-binding protein [Auricularia subglabra TFB-10046 SS5]|nr:NAD(P)-binding protein [Auricularia subglabra TFB-10046 SS5]
MGHSFGEDTTADEVVSTLSERVEGRTFLITGPTSNGIGAATAYALARAHPATILLAGRSPEKYGPVIEKILDIDPNVDVRVYAVDLGDVLFTREAAKKIISEVDKIDVLINNAGVMGLPLKKTVDGIEEHFATNYVGHFLLTNILMPAILKSDEPTIVNLTSGGHRAGTGDYSDYNFERHDYNWHLGYGQSKLANIHFTQYLAKRLGPRGLVSLAVHPGVIWGTSLTSPLSGQQVAELRALTSSMKWKTVGQGAATTLVAALDRELGVENNGSYMADCQVAETQWDGAKLPDAPEKLWSLSETLVKERFTY